MTNNEELTNLIITFINVLEEAFALYKQSRINEIDFISRLSDRNAIFWDYCKIHNIMLNAAISFCDSFFDAVYHGLDDVNGILIDEAEGLIIHIIDVLSKGQELKDRTILSYYCGKGQRTHD